MCVTTTTTMAVRKACVIRSHKEKNSARIKKSFILAEREREWRFLLLALLTLTRHTKRRDEKHMGSEAPRGKIAGKRAREREQENRNDRQRFISYLSQCEIFSPTFFISASLAWWKFPVAFMTDCPLKLNSMRMSQYDEIRHHSSSSHVHKCLRMVVTCSASESERESSKNYVS
jgi:hypothetical protein